MGITLHKNNNLGHIPSTPSTPYIDTMALSTASSVLINHGKSLGYPISYAQEQGGQLIQNVLPVHKTEYQQISTSSKVELAMHTETAFHPYKPDYVILSCLRGDPTAVTTYADIDTIIKKLDLWVIATLQKKWFTTGIDISFRTRGEKDKQIPITVLEKHGEDYSFLYDSTVVKGVDPLAAAALDKLKEAVEDSVEEIVLETGDILVIDNNKTIHGRKPFQARYDGTDRWVQRLLVRKELPPSDQIEGHVITTRFYD
jgi:L-asparagine oxygenase